MSCHIMLYIGTLYISQPSFLFACFCFFSPPGNSPKANYPFLSFHVFDSPLVPGFVWVCNSADRDIPRKKTPRGGTNERAGGCVCVCVVLWGLGFWLVGWGFGFASSSRIFLSGWVGFFFVGLGGWLVSRWVWFGSILIRFGFWGGMGGEGRKSVL